MYHIFIAIALNATQNQVSEVKKYYHDQVSREISYKESGKDSLLPSYPAQPNSRVDVLEQFKKELNQEDEAINKLAKADLESLGLDPVDDLPKKEEKKSEDEFTSSSGQVDQKIDIENIPSEAPITKPSPTSEDKAAEFVALASKFSAEHKKPEPIKDQAVLASENSKNSEVKNKVADASKVLEQELGELDKKVIFEVKKDKAEVKKAEEFVKAEINKEAPKENIAEVKVKNDQLNDKPKDISKDNQASDDKSKSADIKTDKEDIKNADDKKENIPKIKPKTKKELALEKKMRAEEAREAIKLEKLNKLRDKYLAKLESEEDYSDITDYQKISKIIPQPKLLPKYIGYQIPPQLLSRYRSGDNKHHPIVMLYEEKVDLLFKAVAENRVDDFNSLFDQVNRPNLKNMYGDTILSYAILMQKYQAMVSLLSKGADPDLPNDLCYTPLNLAIELTDYRSTYILLDMGANPNYADGMGRTYLMQAVRIGSLPIVDLLLSKGVNINAKDRYGFTALDVATRFNKKVIIKYLQKNGGENSRREYKFQDSSLIEQLNKRWQ